MAQDNVGNKTDVPPSDRPRHGTPRNRSSASLGDLRGTPIMDNFFSMLPPGHDKALKYAFYNVIAVIIAAGIILAMWGVYCILEPFIKALMWATLCGSVLHPFKEQLCDLVRGWLKSSKESSVPFTLLVITSPLKVADSLSDKVGGGFLKHWKSIAIGVLTFIVTYLLYYHPPLRLVALLQWLAYTLFALTAWILDRVNLPVVIGINTAYLVGTLSLVASRRKKRQNAATSDQTDNLAGERDGGDDSFSPFFRSFVLKPQIPWSLTAAYLLMRLPYPILLLVVTCLGLGVNTYLRKQKKKSFKRTLPRFSKLAMMVLNIGDGNMPRRLSQSGSSNQRANRFGFSTPGPGTVTARDEVDRVHLFRSISDSSAATFKPVAGPMDVAEEGSDLSLFTPKSENDVSSDEEENENSGLDSNTFLYCVSMACLVVLVWQRLWLMHLLPVPVVYYALKNLGMKFGLKDYAKAKLSEVKELLDEGAGEYLAPKFVKIGVEIFHDGDKKLIAFCENYVDSVVSSVIVVLVVMASVSGLIFAGTQVYAEGDHLIRVTGNLINKTVSEHPELNQILPEGWQSMLSSMVGNAFIYGREYITSAIRNSAGTDGTIEDQQNAQHMEKQLIELWDRLYIAWNQTYENAFTNVTRRKELSKAESFSFSWDDLFMIGKSNPLELSLLTDYARANVGTLWSIFESLWNILIGNVSLAVSSVTSIISLLVGGGSAIVNLIINLIIFFTALFYLLSLSGPVYKPVELFNQFATGTGDSTSNFAIAVEESVNGVFVASFKMATFYGLWTWLTHTLFQVNIVFVPSIFAGLFAAVPFLMPYWAAIPAVLELWLIQGLWWKALIMFCVQLLPMSAVDAQIYSEIKGGGHPYLTGLAVAGGIFYFGFQGAIIGPVILCLVIVAVKVGRRFMWEDATK